MRRIVVAAIALIGCKKEAGFAGGMPPADDWHTDQAGAVAAPMPQPGGFHGGSGGFHGSTGAPEGDEDEAPQEPSDFPLLGEPREPSGHHSADPDRPVDPAHRIAGVIKLGAKAKGKAKPG